MTTSPDILDNIENRNTPESIEAAQALGAFLSCRSIPGSVSQNTKGYHAEAISVEDSRRLRDDLAEREYAKGGLFAAYVDDPELDKSYKSGEVDGKPKELRHLWVDFYDRMSENPDWFRDRITGLFSDPQFISYAEAVGRTEQLVKILKSGDRLDPEDVKNADYALNTVTNYISECKAIKTGTTTYRAQRPSIADGAIKVASTTARGAADLYGGVKKQIEEYRAARQPKPRKHLDFSYIPRPQRTVNPAAFSAALFGSVVEDGQRYATEPTVSTGKRIVLGIGVGPLAAGAIFGSSAPEALASTSQVSHVTQMDYSGRSMNATAYEALKSQAVPVGEASSKAEPKMEPAELEKLNESLVAANKGIDIETLQIIEKAAGSDNKSPEKLARALSDTISKENWDSYKGDRDLKKDNLNDVLGAVAWLVKNDGYTKSMDTLGSKALTRAILYRVGAPRMDEFIEKSYEASLTKGEKQMINEYVKAFVAVEKATEQQNESTLHGVNPKLAQMIITAAKQYGQDPQTLALLFYVYNHGNLKAIPESPPTDYGYMGMIESMWKNYLSKQQRAKKEIKGENRGDNLEQDIDSAAWFLQRQAPKVHEVVGIPLAVSTVLSYKAGPTGALDFRSTDMYVQDLEAEYASLRGGELLPASPESQSKFFSQLILDNPHISINRKTEDDHTMKSIQDNAKDGKTFKVEIGNPENVTLSPQAQQDLLTVANNLGMDIVVNSFTTGQHAKDSLHYQGLAVDIMPKSGSPEDFQKIVKYLYEHREQLKLNRIIYGGELPDGVKLMRHGQIVGPGNEWSQETLDKHKHHIDFAVDPGTGHKALPQTTTPGQLPSDNSKNPNKSDGKQGGNSDSSENKSPDKDQQPPAPAKPDPQPATPTVPSEPKTPPDSQPAAPAQPAPAPKPPEHHDLAPRVKPQAPPAQPGHKQQNPSAKKPDSPNNEKPRSRSDVNYGAITKINGVSAERVRYVVKLLVEKYGFAPDAAAYWAGNFIQESGLRPEARGDGGHSWGLAQLNGGRHKDLPMPAKKYSPDKWDDYVRAQLEYIFKKDASRHFSPEGWKLRLAKLQDQATGIDEIRKIIKDYEQWGEQGKRFQFGKKILREIQRAPASVHKHQSKTTFKFQLNKSQREAQRKAAVENRVPSAHWG